MDTVHAFIDKVLVLAIKHRFSVTSWIRTNKRNMEVKGDTKSFHLLGLAVDGVLDNPIDLPVLIKDAKRLGLEVIPGQGFFHLEPIG